MLEILYKGTKPPNSFDGLTVIETVTQDEATKQFADGVKAEGIDYAMIVRLGGVQTQYFNPPAVHVPVPVTLSKTTFNKYAASQLGSGVTGMARFQDIVDAAEASKGATKFCFTQYDAAGTFDKTEVDAFTSIMVAGAIMTTGERTAILDNWPLA